LPVRTYPFLIRIRLIIPRPDQPKEYLQTGKHCSTNSKPKIGLLCTHISAQTSSYPSSQTNVEACVPLPQATGRRIHVGVRVVHSVCAEER
jgi:hypothetical protein